MLAKNHVLNVALERSISGHGRQPSTILVVSTCEKISTLNFSISTPKINLAVVLSLNSDPPCTRAKRKKNLKSSKTAATKAPSPIRREIRGFIYTHSQIKSSIIENSFFSFFLSVRRLFVRWEASLRLILRREITIKARFYFLGIWPILQRDDRNLVLRLT
jgi:hypothetical protein